MTVSVSDRQSSNYSGPQSSGHEYEFSFRLHDASMLYVEITDGDGVKTEADPNDYSVTLNYDQYGNPGGIVTYDLALPDGSSLRVISRLEIQQQSELTATPSYVPRNVEDALDYLAMTMQDQGRAVDEAVNVAQDAAASAASAADSADALSTLQSGTPTNVAVAESDPLTDAIWKLQGQTLAARGIAIINTGSGSTYTMTAEESAAAVWTFVGGTADCVVTPVINTLTQGVKYVSTLFSGFDITIGGVKFNKAAYGSQAAFMSEAAGFILAPFSDGAANSRVFEQDTTTYNLADLINGTYNYFSNAGAVTLTVQPHATAAIPANAEYQIEARGAGGLTIVAGSGVTIIPPKGGSLILSQGDFVKIKRTNLDEFKLIGTTV